jgi:hypothetical protein
MSDRFEFTDAIDVQRFDRLVDGELTAAEERQLLASLDAQPDGWRRCALAFLEARCWNKGFQSLAFTDGALNGVSRQVAAGPTRPETNDATTTRHAPSQTGHSSVARSLVLAASILLAFVLGAAAQREWSGDSAMSLTSNGPSHAVTDPPAQVAARGTLQRPEHSTIGQGTISSTVRMALTDGRGNVERQVEVPVVEADQLDPSWLRARPSVLPDEVAESLRHSGHTVEEERLFLPVWLDDGRQAILPLDRAEVKFAGMQF